jgi:two-component system LytT family response regulator
MKTLRTIIIDDEELARTLIRNYLKDQNEIDIIAECENGFDGVKTISELEPDLIFLDIQMPKLNGFELLELVDDPPEVIFITAHNEHAIRAFEMNAVDYLLKPYSRERLLDAVNKARQRIAAGTGRQGKMERLISEPLSDSLERIVVKSGSRIRVIPVEQINYIEAQDDYVMVYTNEGKYLKKGTMKYFEDNLDENSFVRVHRSYIVRIDQVTMIEPYSRENYVMKLKNGTQIRISRSGFKNIREKFNF